MSIADAVDASICIADIKWSKLTPDGLFPAEIDRQYERSLLQLCASRSLSVQQWTAAGPHFFTAGLAVMLASTTEFDRREFLLLAEKLSPGISQPEIFQQWLRGSPLRPSRFLPMLKHALTHAS